MRWIKPKISDEILKNWQMGLELAAKYMNVPAVLILKLYPLELKVLLASNINNNPYKKCQMLKLEAGLYHDAVISQHKLVLIPNAKKNPDWSNNLSLNHGMIAYLGLPLAWQDGETFGVICALDNEENNFFQDYQNLLLQLKNSIESNLNLLLKESEHKLIKEEIQKLKQKLELKKKNGIENLKKSKDKWLQLLTV